MSNTFHEYALEQLGRVVPITSRNMFGGVGIYSANLFFALMDDDSLYCKVDGSNRGDYEDRGLSPFQPFGEGGATMQYYPVPEEILEEPEALRGWVDKAIAVAARKKIGRNRRAKWSRKSGSRGEG